MHDGKPLFDSQPGMMLPSMGSPRFRVSAGKSAVTYRCLVVDDDTTVMQLIAEMLSALGHHVETADNGVSAIKRVVAGRYDLIVTDLEMPAMDGYLLASIIKNHSSDIKTIIMTGHCQAEVFDLMASAVVDTWLFKPFGLSELCHALDDLMSSGN